MSVDAATPVSVIEGIGPAVAAALETIRVYSVFDLLRRSVEQLGAAVQSLASEEQVRSWKSMAMLLQVAELTPQWAEALVLNDVQTISELSRKRLPEVAELMQRAREQGLIPDTPTSDQIAEMIRDAAVITHSGCLTGTLVDAERRAIAGAAVRVGQAQTQSDARGRFRILRIPLGRDIPLRIDHPDYEMLLVERPRIAIDADVIEVHVIQLTPRSAGTEPAAPVRLSELDGDELPVFDGQQIRHVTIGADQIQAGDILMVREFYASSTDVQLVSRLKAYENGQVLVYVVRVPVARLPGEVRLRDHFRFDGAEFTKVEMNLVAMHRYKTRLRMRKAFANRPQPQTPEEQIAEIQARFNFFLEQGFLARRRPSV
ncbi:MAG TPA: DUF4332 domain-containing protein [Lacipirellulaceae bacterium]|nr:DUF4332 domain-containing protein [Lacipirellulaceae bacterium]